MIQSLSSWSALLGKLPPKLHIGSKWCPIMSILECIVVRKWLNHSNRHIRIRLSWLSKNIKSDRNAHILGILVLNIVNIHSRKTSLFSFQTLEKRNDSVSRQGKEAKIPIGRGSSEGMVRQERIPTSKIWSVVMRHSPWVGNKKPTRAS